MNRRNFIKSAILSLTALGLGIKAKAREIITGGIIVPPEIAKQLWEAKRGAVFFAQDAKIEISPDATEEWETLVFRSGHVDQNGDIIHKDAFADYEFVGADMAISGSERTTIAAIRGNKVIGRKDFSLETDFIAHWKGEAWKHIETE